MSHIQKDNYVDYLCQKVGEIEEEIGKGIFSLRRVDLKDLHSVYRLQLLFGRAKDKLILEVRDNLKGMPTSGPGSELYELRLKINEMAQLIEQGRA